MNSHWNKFIVS